MNDSPSNDRAVWLTVLDRLAKTASRRGQQSQAGPVDVTDVEELRVAERLAYRRYLASVGG